MTINERYNVQIAKELERILNLKGFRSKDVFVAMLRTYPAYCRGLFNKKIFPRIVAPFIPRIMNIKGTIKDTEIQFEKIIDEIISLEEEIYEKPRNNTGPYLNISIRN